MPLRQRDPATAVAQRTIKIAFDELEKAMSPTDSTGFENLTLDAVRKTALAWKLFFLTSWGRFEGRFDNILEDLKRHGDQLDREANAYNIAEAKNMRENLQQWRQESLVKAKQYEEEQNTHQLQAVYSWLRFNDNDQHLIFDHSLSEASRHPGTCTWILTQPTIACWLRNQSGNPFIWLKGNPGCGKSVIASQIVKFLSAQGLVVIHYFCTSSYASSTQYDEVLKSLLYQMIRNSSHMAAYVYGQYVGKKTASILVLEQLLQLAATALSDDLGHSRTIYVVIDGLDDLDVEKQKRFLSLTNRISRDTLSHPTNAPCKILVASRTTQLIKANLRKKTVVALSDEKDKLTEAIARYAEQRLKTSRHRFSELHLQDSDLLEIARQIARKADGMFLWARLVLDYLTNNMFYSSQEIREAVDTLPRKLAEFYERVLTQMIAKFDARSVDRLRTIFGWIAFGQRPLRRAEFRSALSYCAGITPVQTLAPSHLFDMCAPLVEEHSDSRLCFIHISLKEYLETAESVVRVNRDRAYLEHAIATTTCLLSGLDVFNPGYSSHDCSMRVIRGLHGFHVFTYEYWIDCVLRVLSQKEPGEHMSQLRSNLSEVSQRVAALRGALPPKDESINPTLEPRLELLRPFLPLYEIAKEALLARNQKKLNYVASNNNEVHKIAELPDVLKNYQTVLQKCLSVREFPGISTEELAQFQRDYSREAFTCRFPSCPRATEGFETDELRVDHEISHASPLKCPIASCQYPAFPTEQALRKHKRNCHDFIINSSRMKSIRKVGHFVGVRLETGTRGESVFQGDEIQHEQDLEKVIGSPPSGSHDEGFGYTIERSKVVSPLISSNTPQIDPLSHELGLNDGPETALARGLALADRYANEIFPYYVPSLSEDSYQSHTRYTVTKLAQILVLPTPRTPHQNRGPGKAKYR
ncbi:hypothetical protein EKO27_g10361 [Xylaria grammica]|uniref:Nephrocystin 3-like N-terminal domain-containing protein n=1 Tax=Xylaria grammica TaxID=363999 RepID=A0A439CRD9_9PEZI|nr:hypothetical protein EKO27_g10361 [Xylaria grammica]